MQQTLPADPSRWRKGGLCSCLKLVRAITTREHPFSRLETVRHLSFTPSPRYSRSASSLDHGLLRRVMEFRGRPKHKIVYPSFTLVVTKHLLLRRSFLHVYRPKALLSWHSEPSPSLISNHTPSDARDDDWMMASDLLMMSSRL